MSCERAGELLKLFRDLPGEVFQKEFRHDGLIGIYKNYGLSDGVFIFPDEKSPAILTLKLSLHDGDSHEDEPHVGLFDESYSSKLDEYIEALGRTVAAELI